MHQDCNRAPKPYVAILIVFSIGCATTRWRPQSTPATLAPVAAPGAPAVSVASDKPGVQAIPQTIAVCPRVPLLLHPSRVRPDVPGLRQGHCGRATPTRGVERVPFGRDIDDALFCIDAVYEGPDGLPLGGMLEGALHHLERVYSQVHVNIGSDSIVVSVGSRSLSIAAVSDVASLTLAMVRIAELARTAVPPSSILKLGNPEHVLLRGATASLAWGADFLVPPGAQTPPPAKTLSASPSVGGESSRQMLTHDIGYVKIVQFSPGTAVGLRNALATQQRLRGIVLDLRGSVGGLLDEGFKLADVFLRRGCIALTVGSDQQEARSAHDEPGDSNTPVVVLTDRLTASGAELLAATLRANDRAVIIGERTLGNGVIQVLLDLDAGGQLVAPIAELLPGDGRSFNGRGLDPDLAAPSIADTTTGEDPAIALATQLLLKARPIRRKH